MPNENYHAGDHYDYPLIIKKLLITPLTYCPDQEIVYRDEFRYSYRALNARIGRLANALNGLGVAAGETVAVFDYDSHRYLECFFAIPMMGAVLQTVNWRLSPDQIIYTINHAEAKLIIINADFLPILAEIRDQLETVRTVVVISKKDGQPEAAFPIAGNYEELLDQSDIFYDFPDLDENTKATTFYTTGTTGLPKGVHYSHRQLVLHTFSVAVALGSYHTIGRFRSDDVYMPITPMFHVHAWGLPYVATLLGAKQVYPGKYEPEMLLKLVQREKVTFSHCVPTVLQMILSSPSARKTDLSKWKIMIGGSRLTTALAKTAREAGITVFTGYGMSETCPVISIGVPKPDGLVRDEDEMLDTVTRTGLPIPLAEIRVVDPDERPLPHDGVSSGEVVLRSPWLTQTYVDAPDKTEDLWREGWLHTGDIGVMNAEGYLQVTDRIKDVIKTGGEWISSLDLENLLSQHEAVLESAAIGVSDAKWGERPLILAVLKPAHAGSVGEAELRQFLVEAAQQGKIPKYGVPDKVRIVEALPKTSVGKINKIALRKEYP